MKKNFGPELKIILTKMCNMVNADYDKINFSEENWFYKYEWSDYDENKFKKWLIEYLEKNIEARKEILGYGLRLNNKKLESSASMFILNYGWKIKLESK